MLSMRTFRNNRKCCVIFKETGIKSVDGRCLNKRLKRIIITTDQLVI